MMYSTATRRRSNRTAAICWGLILLLVLLLFSWGVSFFKPHYFVMYRTRKYELVMSHGTIQFWQTVKTDLVMENGSPVVRETGYGEATQGPPVATVVYSMKPRVLPRVYLSPLRWYSTAWIERGGEALLMVNGTPTPIFFGERASIHGIPHWLAAGMLSVPLLWWLLRRKLDPSARRAAAGLCVRCGYDLRATPERCPECGHLADNPSEKVTA